ncbi:hypothetical protein O181_018190 [Austropuccinia psidii MF-1]|uniref:Uncharacterized protein n=1 Tax=Austropuccinia psidii MF-1 TaxID=1389203 RepID=A0A9Q3C891_9BASI|nr:hypothetical protein [Austropuccinia psidii MF-1]
MKNNSSKRELKPSKNKAKKKMCKNLQLAPEVNERESGALCHSSNKNNDGHQINTTNNNPVEIHKIGGVTNHHEKIVQSPNLDTQEVTTVPNKNISTETQRTVSEVKILLTQTNAYPSIDSASCSLTLSPSHSCMKNILKMKKID